MKRWTAMICLALMAIGMAAQTKVIDKSAKKAPDWVNGAVDGYLVVTVEASTLADAQQKSIQLVTERIIQSVATSVSVSQSNEMSSVSTDGSVEEKEAFRQVSKMKSANLPFLKGISPAKIEDIYWIKVQDKATKREHYEYSVKYPYTKAEQRQLEQEFEKLDAEKMAELETLKKNINSLGSIEEIKSSILQLNTLKEYFFDDVRQSQVDGLIAQYKDLYSAIAISGSLVEEGKLECQMLLNGRPVRVATVPKVTSNCASQIKTRQAGDKFTITYDAVDCLPEEENFINVEFRINGKRIDSKFLISTASADDGNFLVVPEGRVILSAETVSEDGGKLRNIGVNLTLNNRGGQPFVLQSLELNVPELSVPLVIDELEDEYTAKGIIQVKLLTEGEFATKEKSSSLQFVQGALTVVNKKTKEAKRIRLSLPYAVKW